MGNFLVAQWAAKSAVLGRIWLKFELARDIEVLVTCKNENPIKNEGARVLTRLYDLFSDAQWRNSARIRTHPSFYSCPRYLQE